MGQVTIYIEEAAEKQARAAARAEGMSLSKWVAGRIAHRGQAEWPREVKALAGAWSDLPSAAQIRKKAGKDAARGRL